MRLGVDSSYLRRRDKFEFRVNSNATKHIRDVHITLLKNNHLAVTIKMQPGGYRPFTGQQMPQRSPHAQATTRRGIGMLSFTQCA
jgi:hypothetical protein